MKLYVSGSDEEEDEEVDMVVDDDAGDCAEKDEMPLEM